MKARLSGLDAKPSGKAGRLQRGDEHDEKQLVHKILKVSGGARESFTQIRGRLFKPIFDQLNHVGKLSA